MLITDVNKLNVPTLDKFWVPLLVVDHSKRLPAPWVAGVSRVGITEGLGGVRGQVAVAEDATIELDHFEPPVAVRALSKDTHFLP